MGSCLIYSNTVIAGLIIRQMHKMLRNPVAGALYTIVKKRTIATVTRGTKCYILLQYLHTTILIITGLILWCLRLNLQKYFGGFDPPISPPKYGLD